MTTKKVNEREIVLEIISEVTQQGQFFHHVLQNALDKYAFLEKKERAFITRAAEGTIEYLLQTDYVIDRFSSVKTERMKPFIRDLLRMSVYQILYMDTVPDHAACNEAVKLAQKRSFHALKGFVNGVLRTVSRKKDTITFPDLSSKYSMPQWIVDMWLEAYGSHVTEKMLKAFLEPKKLYVRCNTGRASIAQIKQSLQEDGVSVQETQYMEEALELSGYDTLYALDAFQKGYIQVQDLSSMFVARAAMPKKGAQILDVCAAPGGKALHFADVLQGTGYVEARDLTPHKAELIEDNIARTGFSNIKANVWDALVFDEQWEKKADIVVADLPCSGLGVIGRKPDIKYHASMEQIYKLQQLQREILDVVYSYVKPGGILMYSTCTVNHFENEDNVQWLLEKHPFEPVSLEPVEALSMECESKKKGYIQLLPGLHNVDGFFIAKLRRKQ